MKKHTKNAFGLLGLLLVAITTVFAASLPSPEVAALPSVTDTIVVRVIGETPHVEIIEPSSDSIFVSPQQTISYIYDNVGTVTITVEYTDDDGEVHEYVLDTIDGDYNPGEGTLDIDLSGPGFGYGHYVITITGDHQSALPDEDSIEFSYYPVAGTVAEDDDSDNAILELEYDYDEEDEDNNEIKEIIVVVKDEDGNPVPGIPPITVTPPEDTVVIPFGDNDMPGGNYIIEITAYDDDGQIASAFVIEYEFIPTPVPNTGGLLIGLNVSKSDYLATGLIVFFLVGVAGIVAIVRSNKKSRRR